MKPVMLSFVLLLFAGIGNGNPEKKISLNHIGYTPQAEKTCVFPGNGEIDYSIIDMNTQEICYRGKMVEKTSDFGICRTGDFSDFQKKGQFYIETQRDSSYPFTIAPDVYEKPVNTIIEYFSIQRCGASESGYNSPCHIDDGYRVEKEQKTEKHIDVSGGWHDASDLRKWGQRHYLWPNWINQCFFAIYGT